MVIDGARGVEERTRSLMEVCRLRDTPIMTFINKLDRESRDPLSLTDEIEEVLGIRCAPVTWPIGSGRSFRGVYHLSEDCVRFFGSTSKSEVREGEAVQGIENPALDHRLGTDADALREEIELVRGASHAFDRGAYRQGALTPVFFGSALHSFGVRELLDCFVSNAPPPVARPTLDREVVPEEARFTGFVFKIQANMDPQHRDRIAFLRATSGRYRHGMKLHHVRTGKDVQISNALTFMARERARADDAVAGDIIGLHNHGTIRIGDTFTQGERLRFTGIPSFAPELFRRVVLRDPLRMKALQKGLDQLGEEGATQVFRPLVGNDVILGAVGALQFEVVAYRLRHEYGVESSYDPVEVVAARWVASHSPAELERFRARNGARLALDAAGQLTFLAPSRVALRLAQERWPAIEFHTTREL